MKGKLFLVGFAVVIAIFAGCETTPYIPQPMNGAAAADQSSQYTEQYPEPAAAGFKQPVPSTTAVQGLGYAGPLPLRSAAKIMRVWLAPWESTDGSLHLPNYIYAEVVERKWSIGGQKMDMAPQITPLADQVVPSAPEKKTPNRPNQQNQQKRVQQQPPLTPQVLESAKSTPNQSFFNRQTGQPQRNNVFDQLGKQLDKTN